MKLSVQLAAPFFQTTDVFGTDIDLRVLKGKRIYLAFERNAGCPVCNLHTHELLRHADDFKKHNTVVLLVFESPVIKMKEYLGNDSYPFHFIADPDNHLYDLFGAEISFAKLMRSMVNGITDKVSRGKKLFKKPIRQDGHMARIPAEFIINERGVIDRVHYGRFIGDHLPMHSLLPK